MILRSYDDTWPPRRLPSRLRLARLLLGRVVRPRLPRARVLIAVSRRLALWTAWLGLIGLLAAAPDLPR